MHANPDSRQSITAIAHLRSVILYFMDLSEQCGYPVSAQIALFKSIRPLFANKIVFLAINKIDVTGPEDLDAETQQQIQAMVSSGEVADILHLSCSTQEGVQEAKNAACERLIAERVSQKVKAGTSGTGEVGGRLAEVMKRIHVAMPMDGQTRETFIPDAVKTLQKYDKSDSSRRMLARDVEELNGGAGVFSVDLKADYILENPEWKHDKIPEVFDGKNVADWIDPDIDARLAELEDEEERLNTEGFYNEDEEPYGSEDERIMGMAEQIREEIGKIRSKASLKKRLHNRAIIPRSKTKKTVSQMDDALDVLGHDTSIFMSSVAAKAEARGRSRTRSRAASRAGTEGPDAMDMDKTPKERLREKSRMRSMAPLTNRRVDGVGENEAGRTRAERMAKLNQKKMNRMARQGEADRHTTASLAKHLVRFLSFHSPFSTKLLLTLFLQFAGKRGIGKTSHR
jgi:nucleolar GTP-binding protein